MFLSWKKALQRNAFSILFICLSITSIATSKTAFEKAASSEEEARLKHFYHDSEPDFTRLDDPVFVAIFVRNKEHSLPYFFRAIEDLDYDKSRMFLWIVCDHTRDNSVELIAKWVEVTKKNYHGIHFENPEGPQHYPKEMGELDWVKERHLRMLELRQLAVIKARKQWASYLLFIDADNILMNPYSLRHLIKADKVLVAPMLDSTTMYSNFWGGMDEKGYYLRVPEYFPIRNREKNGTIEVPMVHSTFLIDLTKSKSREIQFLPVRDDYKLDFDDIIVFAHHCKAVGISMHVNNEIFYGYLPVPLKTHQTFEEEKEGFLHLRMEALTELPIGIGITMKHSKHIPQSPTEPSKLGLDEIYLINLKRRPERRLRMKKVLNMQMVDYKLFDAVDSHSLNTTYLKKLGIDVLPGFVDPYKERSLTRGEIGCFLSHFTIWQEVLEKEYAQILILEDDIRFEPGFVRKMKNLLEKIKIFDFEWDLIYIGRKRLKVDQPEDPVPDFDDLVVAGYSYWTLGYLLSYTGAQKLIDGNPLGRMVPVDEYLPIMYDTHPIARYSDQFPRRDLAAFSVIPLYIYPTQYTGEINYFSDTETSSIWDEEGDQDPSILDKEDKSSTGGSEKTAKEKDEL